MGKRIALAIVVISVSLLVSFVAQSPSSDGVELSLKSFYGLPVQATEVNSKALIQKLNILSDSVEEMTIIHSSSKSLSVIKVSASAYSSDPDQTDDTPFITASGSTVRDGIVATNFLPFGTKIKIPKVFGDKVFTVEDRMNARYNEKQYIDIWFDNTLSAIHFGRKTVLIEIISMPEKALAAK